MEVWGEGGGGKGVGGKGGTSGSRTVAPVNLADGSVSPVPGGAAAMMALSSV